MLRQSDGPLPNEPGKRRGPARGPGFQRDPLAGPARAVGRLAREARLFVLVWSDDLLAGAKRALIEDKPVGDQIAERWISYPRDAFPDGPTSLSFAILRRQAAAWGARTLPELLSALERADPPVFVSMARRAPDQLRPRERSSNRRPA